MKQLVIGSLFLFVLTAKLNADFILIGADEGSFPSSLLPNAVQGYDFVPQKDLSLSAIGFWDQGLDGLPRQFEIGIWETAPQTLLASITIDDQPVDDTLLASGGAWRYQELKHPIRLAAGTTYCLAFQVGPVSLDANDALLVDFDDIAPNSNIFIEDNQRFTLNTTSLVFPINSTPAGPGFRANVNGRFGLIGDVNCDGSIDLLDVQPFVDSLASGLYEIKADINGDGENDLLDVAPFVDLVSDP